MDQSDIRLGAGDPACGADGGLRDSMLLGGSDPQSIWCSRITRCWRSSNHDITLWKLPIPAASAGSPAARGASAMSETLQVPAQSIRIQTPGVHHIALRVHDFEHARRFYIDTLGFELLMEVPGLFLFRAGETAFGVRAPVEQSPAEDVFSPFRVGLDHIALACTDEAELNRVAQALQAAGVENTGVKHDETLGKNYVSFKDPDRIAWEFYMA
jgi:glyoxylase I family protein